MIIREIKQPTGPKKRVKNVISLRSGCLVFHAQMIGESQTAKKINSPIENAIA
jgi:hypothetical protein